jgi:hypothetical protein
MENPPYERNNGNPFARLVRWFGYKNHRWEIQLLLNDQMVVMQYQYVKKYSI